MKIAAVKMSQVEPNDIIVLSISGQVNVCKVTRNDLKTKMIGVQLCQFDSNHDRVEWTKEYNVSVASVESVIKFVDEADVSKLEILAYETKPWFNAKLSDSSITQSPAKPTTETTKQNVKPN